MANKTKNSPKIRKIKNGIRVYFPWNKKTISLPNETVFEKTRLSRNQNLILPEEQKKLKKLKIAIAGLNVGNPAAICMTLEGVGGRLKFADNDVLTLDNLNRFRASLTNLGINKAVLSAQQIHEINPFLQIDVYEKGITPENLKNFLLKPRVDILIEEMDHLWLKIKIREVARASKIPVVMVTGNAENVILDVERFDLDPKLPLLNGHLKPHILKRILELPEKPVAFKEKIKLCRDFIGERFLTPRLQQSFKDAFMGKLAGIPQLAESSFLRGAVICYAVRQITLGKKMSSGRYFLNLTDIIDGK